MSVGSSSKVGALMGKTAGEGLRREYGEPFYAVETMEVDDVVTLTVRSI